MPTYYNKGGIRIEIRTRENGHNEPHVHVMYAGESMSISLITVDHLAGIIHNTKVEKRAIQWIRENKDVLLDEWRKYHV